MVRFTNIRIDGGYVYAFEEDMMTGDKAEIKLRLARGNEEYYFSGTMSRAMIRALWNLRSIYEDRGKLDETEVIYWGEKEMMYCGGLNPDSDEAQAHAKKMYASIRSRSLDYEKIAKNTGFSIEQIQVIKNSIFSARHLLPGKEFPSRFHESYEMAESWRRLSEKSGKNIQYHDILLLHHELYEIQLLLSNPNMTQHKAHLEASRVHNYSYYSDVFYGNV